MASQANMPDSPFTAGNRRGLRILVVEDNLAYAEEIIGYLRDKGHAVRGATTAADMWNRLAEANADILLLDLGLPDEDGSYLIHQVRSRHPEMGMVIVTARTRLETRVDSLTHGADHYLTKPIKLVELNAIINTLSRRVTQADVAQTDAGWVLYLTKRERNYSPGSLAFR